MYCSANTTCFVYLISSDTSTLTKTWTSGGCLAHKWETCMKTGHSSEKMSLDVIFFCPLTELHVNYEIVFCKWQSVHPSYSFITLQLVNLEGI